jgi:hypothetical protein
MNNRGRCIIAAALFLCWAIFNATWHLVPAIMMAGKNYSNPEEAFSHLRTPFWPLVLIAWLCFIAAILISIWGLWEFAWLKKWWKDLHTLPNAEVNTQ